jgi:ABC-type sugar transport system permease subunit
MRFVGFENYMKVLTTQRFLTYFITNLIIILFSIPITQVIAFMLANLLRKKMFFSAFFETIYFLPLLVSMVGAGIIMAYLFSPNAPINFFLQLLGLKPLDWLGTPAGARAIIVVIESWKDTGFYVFVYLTALRAIPTDYYEIASLEGAKSYQVLFRITIPMVRRTIFYCLTIVFIWQTQIFDSAYIATRGGPMNSTKTIVYAIYETTFLSNNPGLGSTISVFFLIIILAVTVIQNYYFSTKFDILEY